jgi:hypothetical protein
MMGGIIHSSSAAACFATAVDGGLDRAEQEKSRHTLGTRPLLTLNTYRLPNSCCGREEWLEQAI